MEWNKEWLFKEAQFCPFCRELVYPENGGYVCRSASFCVEKKRSKPDRLGFMSDLKFQKIFLFYHLDCYMKMTEEQRNQCFFDEAKRRGLR